MRESITTDPQNPQVVVATWNTPLWGRRRGHTQEVELTDIVRGAAGHGYITLTTLDGAPVPVDRAPAKARPGQPQPPSSRPVAAPRPKRSRIVHGTGT